MSKIREWGTRCCYLLWKYVFRFRGRFSRRGFCGFIVLRRCFIEVREGLFARVERFVRFYRVFFRLEAEVFYVFFKFFGELFLDAGI